MFSKPFVRESFANKLIDKVIKMVKTFFYTRNINSVAEKITGELDRTQNQCYCYELIDNQSLYAGVFTADNLVLYLSEMTQRDEALAK
jgi:hypothetical protein